MPLAPFNPFSPSQQNPNQALIKFLNDTVQKLNTLLDVYGIDGTDITLPPGGVIYNGVVSATGCILSNNGSDATNDLDISAGWQRDSSNVYTIRPATSFTKRADATWAAGTGNGGMATGSFSATTDYHVHLLGKSTDPTAFDYIYDTSATCTNGLANTAVVTAGFDIYKRVGSLRTGGSAAWPTFWAREIGLGQVEYLVIPLFQLAKDWTGADDTAQTGTLANVPGGIQVTAILGVTFTDGTPSAVSGLLVTAIDQTDTAPSGANASFVAQLKIPNTGGTDGVDSTEIRVRTSTNRTFRYRAVGSTVDHGAAFCLLGWVDSRL